MLCVVIDVVILTVASSVNSARLKPVETEDVRHGTEVDVGIINISVTKAYYYQLLSIGGWDHTEPYSIFVCVPLETHLAWNVVWIQGNHSDDWSDHCSKDEKY